MIWFVHQGRSTEAYSIQIEVFVIMLSRTSLPLFYSFPDKCVRNGGFTRGSMWLAILRFIFSITWRPECPKVVIDTFLAEGTVEMKNYSHLQFGSLRDYTGNWKPGSSQTTLSFSFPNHQTPELDSDS